jgi:hypothetical protein
MTRRFSNTIFDMARRGKILLVMSCGPQRVTRQRHSSMRHSHHHQHMTRREAKKETQRRMRQQHDMTRHSVARTTRGDVPATPGPSLQQRWQAYKVRLLIYFLLTDYGNSHCQRGRQQVLTPTRRTTAVNATNEK